MGRQSGHKLGGGGSLPPPWHGGTTTNPSSNPKLHRGNDAPRPTVAHFAFRSRLRAPALVLRVVIHEKPCVARTGRYGFQAAAPTHPPRAVGAGLRWRTSFSGAAYAHPHWNCATYVSKNHQRRAQAATVLKAVIPARMRALSAVAVLSHCVVSCRCRFTAQSGPRP